MSNPQKANASGIEIPPTSLFGILRRLGPGLIVAGSIVGSGELIATTSTGAQAGFALLWIILIGCVIKVFVQVEMGRYAIVSGKTTMEGLSEVPGPRIKGRGNWLIWYWFVMFLASIAQLGGIVGGVGQALSISAPLTQSGAVYNVYAEAETQLIVKHKELEIIHSKQYGPANRPVTHLAIIDVEKIVQLEIENAQSAAQLSKIQEVEDYQEFGALQNRLSELLKLAVPPAAFQADEGAQEPKVVNPSLAAKQKLVVQLFQLRALTKAISDHQSLLDKETDSAKKQTLQEELATANEKLKAAKSQLTIEAEQCEMEGIVELYSKAQSHEKLTAPIDDKIWAGIVTAITVVILVNGRFGLIQSFSTSMVALFTLITVVNLALLQSNPTWGVSVSDIVTGMRFRLSDNGDGMSALSTALKTFGIIGVGASELVTYPYWCLEKGYGRFTGENDGSSAWLARARGWLNVMRWDAWCSMVIYTFATVAFYLLGAAILGRTQLQPEGTEMIRYLSVMYEPVFGTIAQVMFLFGAFAVLYSTFFVANASHARVFSDAVRVMGLVPKDEKSYRRRVQILSGVFPCLCFVIYCFIPKPTQLVLLSGLMQALMLPMLSAAALFYRYFRTSPELRPSIVWDVFLWTSVVGMFIAGGWLGWSQIGKLFG